MDINWNIVLTLLPVLSVLIIVLRKFFPDTDPYFRKGAVILAEVDDIIDAVLLEFPENQYLNTINDIIDKVLEELKEAGYKIDEKDEKKIAYHIKGRIKREEGTRVKWEDGKLKLEYNTKF